MIENTATRHHQNFLQVIHSYYQFTKPWIIPLLLMTYSIFYMIRTYAPSAVKPGFFVRIWLRNRRFLVETGFLCLSPDGVALHWNGD
jgi:hypothetical protein